VIYLTDLQLNHVNDLSENLNSFPRVTPDEIERKFMIKFKWSTGRFLVCQHHGQLRQYNFFDEIKTDNGVAKNILINESYKLKRIIYDVYKDNSKLLTLNGWEFEEMIAELMNKQGYIVELTRRTKDDGYDIMALLNIKMQSPLKFLVECKRYTSRKVGVEVIRSFKEVIDTEKANRGIIAATTYFTKGALDKQRETPYLLDYRDKDEVIKWVNDYFKAKVPKES